MNVKYGASLLSWIKPLWTNEAGLYAIEKTAEAGFDLIEILLPHTMNVDAVAVKKHLKKHNLQLVCSLNLNKEMHLPLHPKKRIV
ncbi:hypothetical protein [Wenyingzhuangia aestuarii]|uniref:hypothetical protein n=1 Tax=Wenyingzhuangia aestuarii TaxID=1647582 RepID=UPI001FD86A42|nr:hypothetical protein [Wenyingzhuangia aestuarii]NJB81486.1 sugar phosphate isomerase/epimerase [Wenyingzhuangia aestuarii]